jgi:hypothetical protein
MDERLATLSDAELARLADLLAEAIHLGLLVREVDSTPYIELAAMCTAERAVRQFRARRHCGTVDVVCSAEAGGVVAPGMEPLKSQMHRRLKSS